MAAINFPNSPNVGQVHEHGDYRYTFDGVKWTSVVKYGASAVKIQSSTPPGAPEPGLQWFDDESGRTYFWHINEGTNQGQWVEDAPQGIVEREDASNAFVVADGGNTPRDLSERFSDIINIKDFGLQEGGEITAALMSGVSLFCRVNRKTAYLSGTYTMSEDVVCDFNLDASDATITTDNTFIVGRDTNFVRDNITVHTPNMTAINVRPGTDTVGVRIKSITNSEIHVGRVYGYTKGLQVVSHGAPVVYNTIYLKNLDDNYINLAIETLVYTPDPAYISYCNENLFIGGHLSMSPQASIDPNRVQIYGNNRDQGINGNYWLKTSVEFPTYGSGQPSETMLRFQNGCSENFLIGLRTEGIGDFNFETGSSNNNLSFGSQSTVSNVRVEESGGSFGNYVERMGKNGSARSLYAPVVYQNSLSNDRSIMDFVAALGAGGVHNRSGSETTYSTRFLHDAILMKDTPTKNYPEITLSPSTPRFLEFTDGFNGNMYANIPITLSTSAAPNGTNFLFSAPFQFDFINTPTGYSTYTADVTATDGTNHLIGKYVAIVQYTGTGNYSVITENFRTDVNDFATFTFSLVTGASTGASPSPRVSVTGGTGGTINVQAIANISAATYNANS